MTSLARTMVDLVGVELTKDQYLFFYGYKKHFAQVGIDLTSMTPRFHETPMNQIMIKQAMSSIDSLLAPYVEKGRVGRLLSDCDKSAELIDSNTFIRSAIKKTVTTSRPTAKKEVKKEAKKPVKKQKR